MMIKKRKMKIVMMEKNMKKMNKKNYLINNIRRNWTKLDKQRKTSWNF